MYSVFLGNRFYGRYPIDVANDLVRKMRANGVDAWMIPAPCPG